MKEPWRPNLVRVANMWGQVNLSNAFWGVEAKDQSRSTYSVQHINEVNSAPSVVPACLVGTNPPGPYLSVLSKIR